MILFLSFSLSLKVFSLIVLNILFNMNTYAVDLKKELL